MNNFNDFGISIANRFLSGHIEADAVFNIITERFGDITSPAQGLEQGPLINKIILYKRMGFEDKLLLSLALLLDTQEKENRFRTIISMPIPGTTIRVSQNVAFNIIDRESSNRTVKIIHNLIINGVGLEVVDDQEYAFHIATDFTTEQIQYFFELVRRFGFTNTYAYMSIVLFNEDRERINNIINNNSINGFTIAQAFTIERQFTQEMKEFVTELITANYPGDIIYGIMTDGKNNVDDELDSEWQNEEIEQITTNIERINQLIGEEFGFNSIQAFHLMHTPIENIILLREHFNVENSFNSRMFSIQDIQLMIRLTTEFNFSEEYAVIALSNLTQNQIDIMIELKQNNIEDEYCYRVVTMENYNEFNKNLFINMSRSSGSANAFEFIQDLE
jgi:hypothetical protein